MSTRSFDECGDGDKNLHPVKGLIFILNRKLTSLSFWESWSFKIVSELGLASGSGFESPFYNLNPHLLI